ncbi:MAG: hypothetical protein LBV50_04635 [Novosphingobium sp.]|nr:hypothetical protein [Novosphingobium sp.]
MPVTLPDAWKTRWPDYDGVVWYRLSWMQTDTAPTTGLLLENVNRLAEVSVNGSLLMQRAADAAPSRQARGEPRYWLLSPPLLRHGENSLLVRVPGLASYGAGLGTVRIGDAAGLEAGYAQIRAHRLQPLTALIMQLTLGGLFLALWLMHRRETVYGWYGLNALLSFSAGLLASTADGLWFLRDIHVWHRAWLLMFLLSNAAFVIFILRFCDLRRRRAEAGLWLLVAGAAATVVLMPPQSLFLLADILMPTLFVIVLGAELTALWRTWRTWHLKRIDLRILSLFFVLSMAAYVQDLWAQSSYAFWYTYAELSGVALALAWRFADSLRRIAGFNTELIGKIAAARGELAQTLQHQHELEVANARLGERLALAGDLHDSLGGTLVTNILALEQEPRDPADERLLTVLGELRDELQDIIETVATGSTVPLPLARQIAPLRHRITGLFQRRGIACRWKLPGSDAVGLVDTRISADVMRLVQECLTNALRHSGASAVDVELAATGTVLSMSIRDDGCGFDPAAVPAGLGLRSMRARTERLGGTFEIRSSGAGTELRFVLPGAVRDESEADGAASR